MSVVIPQTGDWFDNIVWMASSRNPESYWSFNTAPSNNRANAI